MLWRFNSVFNPQRQIADHHQPVRYQMRLPPPPKPDTSVRPRELYVLRPAPTRPAVSG
jgi:hypothetical protein